MSAAPISREQADRIVAIANLALAEHIIEHVLPVPLDISLPSYVDDDRGLNVRIAAIDITEWLHTVEIIDQTREVRDHPVFGPWHRTEYSVRLPDTGTRLVLTSSSKPAVLAVAR